MNWSMYEPLILITWILGLFVLVTAGIYLLAGIKNRNKYYKEKIKELKDQVDWYRELLEEQKKHYQEEIRKLTKISSAVKSLVAALDEGLIEIRHVEDNGKVVVLKDGTLVCDKGHVVYPKPDKQQEQLKQESKKKSKKKGNDNGRGKPGMDNS